MTAQQMICEVEYGSPEYEATLALRDAILRKPLGLHFTQDELASEKSSRHVACYSGQRLAGCLVLRPRSGGDVQMRQVAVVPDLQGQGSGRAMVEYSEKLAGSLGYRRMVLHARDTAVSFYEKLGYSKIGDSFLEVSIPHWEMAKPLVSSIINPHV